MFEVIFLGTGSMKPTQKRFTTSFVLRHEGESILFDAGEGVQVRLSQSGLSPNKISKIFISHFHGDHFYGIPGLIFSMSHGERTKKLTIYGPKKTREFIEKLLSVGYSNLKFPVEVIELKNGERIEEETYTITAFSVEHGPPALGYLFKEKDTKNIDSKKMKKHKLTPNKKFRELKNGKEIEIDGLKMKPEDWLVDTPGDSLVYSGDTIPCDNTTLAAKAVTVLIHESTYLDGETQEDRGHSTSLDAAKLAKKAKAKNLILTHFSPRYLDTKPLLESAKTVFPNTYLSKDLKGFVIKRGELVV
ncbi:MAG: ribonuclease Z [Candidatus Altiarchaeota archaeon]|nr:ribonuclease Z [Candidatus Altiarchaeota archaeon]